MITVGGKRIAVEGGFLAAIVLGKEGEEIEEDEKDDEKDLMVERSTSSTGSSRISADIRGERRLSIHFREASTATAPPRE